jgi:hypothetical protein
MRCTGRLTPPVSLRAFGVSCNLLIPGQAARRCLKVHEPIILLFKVGTQKDMLDLLHNGHVYMQTLGDFKALEDGTPRSDPNEATAYCFQMDGYTLEMQVGGDWQLLGTLDGGVRVHDTGLQGANIYCLHARSASQCADEWSLADLGYGEYFIVFYKPAEFLSRLQRAAEAAGHEIQHSPVEYVDRHKYHGPMGAFRKFSERAQDSEFRILVSPGVGAPMSLRLGSLTDIAAIGPTAGRVKLIPATTESP